MRRTVRIAICLVVLRASTAHAAEPELRSPQPEALKSNQDVPPEQRKARNRTGDEPPQRKAAQYRWHQDRWWYCLPGGQWLVWNGTSWQSTAAPAGDRGFRDASPVNSTIGKTARNVFGVWGARPSPEQHGWVGGFYSSGGGYGASDFGYGYGVPTYGPIDK